MQWPSCLDLCLRLAELSGLSSATFTEVDCQGFVQDYWWTVDACSTDWTLSESRECWKCAEDLVWPTEDTVVPSARIEWPQVDFRVANVHLVREPCSMAHQPLVDWK